MPDRSDQNRYAENPGDRPTARASCYHEGMPKRSRKVLSDPDVAALDAVERSTADEAVIQAEIESGAEAAAKDPAAVALGRKGGLKGGPARKAALRAAQRQTAARKAAAARWNKKPR